MNIFILKSIQNCAKCADLDFVLKYVSYIIRGIWFSFINYRSYKGNNYMV